MGLLATLTGSGLTTPAVLLTLFFVIGCGQALTAPAWQVIQPDLVPAEQIRRRPRWAARVCTGLG